MKTPAKLAEFLRLTYHERAEEMLAQAAAVELVRMGAVSGRRAADLLEMSWPDFDQVLAQHDVPTLDITLEELHQEDSVFERLRNS